MSQSLMLLWVAVVWVAATAGSTPDVAAHIPAVIGTTALAVACGLAVGVSWWLRTPGLFVATSVGLSVCLATGQANAYQPISSGRLATDAILVTDPVERGHGLFVEAKLASGERVRLVAHGPVAWKLEAAVMGERVALSGTARPMEETGWARSRHLVGQVTVDEASVVGPQSWWLRPGEFVRNLIRRGSAPFEPDEAALYRGLVVGDDRDQHLAQRARFRAVGLSHLLAVSGQNVAFALAAARPALARTSGAIRVGSTLLLLAAFAGATRFEPSVTRATVTAGLATVVAFGGWSGNGLRVLCVAVVGLVWVDPFLTSSVGFELSVAASAGILILASPIADALPGPRPLAEALAVTVAAQLFVIPILVVTFGPVSVLSVPANLAAGWAAGLVMSLGLTVGLVAGVMAEGIPGLAEWLQWPTSKLVWWIDQVATISAQFRAPRVTLFGGLTLVVLGLAWRMASRWIRVMIVLCAVWSLLVAIPPEPSGTVVLDHGGHLFVGSERSLLLVNANADDRLVEEVLDASIFKVDVIVVARGTRLDAELVAALVSLTRPSLVLAPPLHRIVGARRVTFDIVVDLGGVALTLVADGDRLRVTSG